MAKREIPLTVLAVDAFGREAVEAFFPDWEFQNDLAEEDFIDVARKSTRSFVTDGVSLFPGEQVAQFASELVKYEPTRALETFGLRLLGQAAERGVTALTETAIRRHRTACSSQNIENIILADEVKPIEAPDEIATLKENLKRVAEKLAQTQRKLHEATRPKVVVTTGGNVYGGGSTYKTVQGKHLDPQEKRRRRFRYAGWKKAKSGKSGQAHSHAHGQAHIKQPA